MSGTVFINGKFTAQRLTGVQRYAGELVRALDALVDDRLPCELLVPPQGVPPTLRRIRVRRVGGASLPLHLWEQTRLPGAAHSGLLLNLTGSAPLLARRQWCTFHDAAVFDHPEAYSPAFVRWYRFSFRWQARHAERLLTVSAHSRSRLADRLTVDPSCIDLVPNGLDHLARIEADPGAAAALGLADQPWLLAVGSDNPVKNWPRLLQAWRLAALGGSHRLVLVGGRDPAVFATTAAAPDPAGVLRVGPVSDATLKALIQGAHGLVFPSLDEGFGLPPLEAMSVGCPVAVARAGAMPALCGDAALYFDPQDVDAIATALRQLVEDTALRRRLMAAGPVQVAPMTWQRSASCLLALLRGAHPATGVAG